MPETSVENLTSGRRLVRNALLNLLGQGVPLLAALFSIPLLVSGLGVDRFGMLTLAWMVLGYFSLFDLGLGRALTKLVAERLGKGEAPHMINPLVGTALLIMALLGLLATAIVLAISSYGVYGLLKLPASLKAEAVAALNILACSIPVVITSTGLIGVLEAHQRFDLINWVRIPLGILTFVAPLMVLPFTSNLAAVVSVLLCVRILAWISYAAMVRRVLPGIATPPVPDWDCVGGLLAFGGWMTVSNIISPVMVYLDRFVIGAVVSAAAVAYYATPYEVVTKLWIIPGAVAASVFPAFAAARAGDLSRAPALFSIASRGVLLLMTPVVLVLIVFADDLLRLWLGPEFAQNSAVVLKLLAAGVFINSLGQVFFASVQGYGRPDLTAKLHMVELPVYVLLLSWLLNDFGIAGAAIAWVVRVAIDTGLLLVLSVRLVPSLASVSFGILMLGLAPLPVFLGGAVLDGIMAKAGYAIVAETGLLALAFCAACSRQEREALAMSLRKYWKVLGSGRK